MFVFVLVQVLNNNLIINKSQIFIDTLTRMVDHKAAADKQIDSMTDKVKSQEIAGAGSAVENLQSQGQVEYMIPDKADMEVL